jgi:hypothetical protein
MKNKKKEEAKEKVNDLVVIVSNESGICYEVALTKEETVAIIYLISQMHNGKIRVLDEELDMKIERKRECEIYDQP